MFPSVTPLILTYNEEPNIKRTLECLTDFQKIIVIDSFSTDKTIEILSQFPNVEVFFRKFDSHATQWNFGLDKVSTDWVLSLDADYILTKSFLDEVSDALKSKKFEHYIASFKFCVFGRPLKSDNTTPRIVLFKKSGASYVDEGHTQILLTKGDSGKLSNSILHDDRKSLSRWLANQDKYIAIEAEKLNSTPYKQLDFRDKIRQLVYLSPIFIFLYCLIVKGKIWEGRYGWHYTMQRTLVEILLSIRLTEKYLENGNPKD